MDSAARNFFTLVGTCAILGAYTVWGLIAYIAIPLFSTNGGAFDSLAGVLSALILALVLLASGGLTAATLRRQITASRHLSRRIEATGLPLTPKLGAAAELSGLRGRVTLIDAEDPFSFVYGFLAPRVAISSGFLDVLTKQELRAALAHERYHVGNLDPFRTLTAKVLSEAFSLKVLRARYEVARELAADRGAEQGCGRRPLLGALLKALEGVGWQQPAISASLGGSELLVARLSRLETGRMPALEVVNYSSLAWSSLGAVAFLAVFLAAMIGLGGTAAPLRAAAYELSATGISLDALCIAPVVAAAFSYRRLARRASQPLSSIAPRV
jgi:Peptidase family M48